MDNNSGGKMIDSSQFFTAGAGVLDEKINANPARKDISNLDPNIPAPKTPEISDLSDTPEASMPQNNQAIGNRLISLASKSNEMPQESMASAKLGEVVELSMPPDTIKKGEESDTDKETELLIDGKLSKQEVDILKRHEAKLSQDGNIIDFYDYITKVRQKAVEEKTS